MNSRMTAMLAAQRHEEFIAYAGKWRAAPSRRWRVNWTRIAVGGGEQRGYSWMIVISATRAG